MLVWRSCGDSSPALPSCWKNGWPTCVSESRISEETGGLESLKPFDLGEFEDDLKAESDTISRSRSPPPAMAWRIRTVWRSAVGPPTAALRRGRAVRLLRGSSSSSKKDKA